MLFTGTAQHAPVGQTGCANRGLERPGGTPGRKGQGWRLMGCALPGVFCAGVSTLCAKRAMRLLEIGFWKSTCALFE